MFHMTTTETGPCRCIQPGVPCLHDGHCCCVNIPAIFDAKRDRMPCHDAEWRAAYNLPEPTERPTL